MDDVVDAAAPEVTALAWRISDTAAAIGSAAVERTDRCGVLSGRGFVSTQSWLTATLRWESRRSSSTVRSARRLAREFAPTRDAWLAQRITGAHARVVADGLALALEPVAAEDRDAIRREAESLLLEVAGIRSVDRTKAAVKRLRIAADPDGASAAAMAADAAQWLRLTHVGDGWALRGWLSDLTGAAVAAVLNGRRASDQHSGSSPVAGRRRLVGAHRAPQRCDPRRAARGRRSTAATPERSPGSARTSRSSSPSTSCARASASASSTPGSATPSRSTSTPSGALPVTPTSAGSSQRDAVTGRRSTPCSLGSSPHPARSSTTAAPVEPSLGGCAAGWRTATAAACSPAAIGPPGRPRRTTCGTGPTADPPRSTTSRSSAADITRLSTTKAGPSCPGRDSARISPATGRSIHPPHPSGRRRDPARAVGRGVAHGGHVRRRHCRSPSVAGCRAGRRRPRSPAVIVPSDRPRARSRGAWAMEPGASWSHDRIGVGAVEGKGRGVRSAGPCG